MSRTVLVIDDSEIVLGVAQSILEGAGYRVATHSRSTGSVALILQTKPDLVLLDVNMPSVRGDMVARMSAATRLATGTIVVLHSTLNEAELKALAEECGAHGYIRKTNNPHTFLRQVASFVGEKESSSQRTLKSSGSYVPESERSPNSSSRARGQAVLLVDRDMAELSEIRKMVQQLGYVPDFALSVQQGIDKLRAARETPAVIASSDLPNAGVSKILDAALEKDPTFRERFILITSLSEPVAFPQRFAGMVLTRPIDLTTLQKVLDRATTPLSRKIARET